MMLELQRLLKSIEDQITTEFDLAYKRGYNDALLDITKQLSKKMTSPSRSESQRQRVERGAPEAFVRRVLKSMNGTGITPSQIKDCAITDLEKKISYSAIRLHLANAAKAGWARNTGRKWYYVEGAGR